MSTDATAVLDRVTDLFEKWAAEEDEHRQAGEYGIAEGLSVAIEELREAVHGHGTIAPPEVSTSIEDAAIAMYCEWARESTDGFEWDTKECHEEWLEVARVAHATFRGRCADYAKPDHLRFGRDGS